MRRHQHPPSATQALVRADDPAPDKKWPVPPLGQLYRIERPAADVVDVHGRADLDNLVAAVAAIAVVDSAELQGGQTVLVVGATGGLGNQEVQLAVKAGAHVVATAASDEERWTARPATTWTA